MTKCYYYPLSYGLCIHLYLVSTFSIDSRKHGRNYSVSRSQRRRQKSRGATHSVKLFPGECT